jgi:uncharacterized integral membrane protein
MTDDPPEVRTESGEPQPLCPNCMTAPEPGAHVCKECGAPLDLFATTDPIETIRSQGWAYRRAASGRRSGIILLGMWLIFGTAIASTVVTLLIMFAHVQEPLEIIVATAVVLPLLAVCVLILRKCMSRRSDNKNDNDHDPPEPA